MGGFRGNDILERMCDLIAASEDRLMDELLSSVRESGLSRGPRGERDWRDSVRVLSDAVLQAVYAVPFGYAEGVVGTDPVVAFGMLRGQRHHANGVDSAAWHELMRHHRRVFVELIESAGLDEDDEEVCRYFLNRVFDRFERGFEHGYAEAAGSASHRLQPATQQWPVSWSIAEDAGGTVS